MVSIFHILLIDEIQRKPHFFLLYFYLLHFLITVPERAFVLTFNPLIWSKVNLLSEHNWKSAFFLLLSLSVCDRFIEQICCDRQIGLEGEVVSSRLWMAASKEFNYISCT